MNAMINTILTVTLQRMRLILYTFEAAVKYTLRIHHYRIYSQHYIFIYNDR